MRRPIESLLSLIERAHKLRTEAAKNLCKAFERYQQAQERATLLAQYQTDYEARSKQTNARGATTVQVMNFTRFNGQLTDAIAAQALDVTHCENELNRARQTFLEEERRHKSFSLLVERHERQQQTRDAKQAQKQTDEFSNRSASVKPTFG